MSPTLLHWFDLAFRWIHVIAGVLFVGALWFFGFVHVQIEKELDAETKLRLLPRAYYLLRVGALFVWLSGLLLLGVAVYHGGVMENGPLPRIPSMWIGFASLPLGFTVYDLLVRFAGKSAAIVSCVLFVLVGCAYIHVMTPRAAFIHLGGMLGTLMVSNVWMRIWPAQRKILAALAKGETPDGALVADVAQRMRHDVYLSVPLLFFMLSSHYPLAYGMTIGGFNAMPVVVTFVLLVGFAIAKHLLLISGRAKPAKL